MINKTIIVIMLLFIISGCGGKKYQDVHELIIEMTMLEEKYFKIIPGISGKRDIITELEKYSEERYIILVKGKKIYDKYPELNDQHNLPGDLKALIDKYRVARDKQILAAEPILKKYKKDPDVKKAIMQSLLKQEYPPRINQLKK
jgi:hypothetical protein